MRQIKVCGEEELGSAETLLVIGERDFEFGLKPFWFEIEERDCRNTAARVRGTTNQRSG